MKKKFERIVEKDTTAKVKWRRIMSVFLAAAMFVSGGSFSKLADVGFAAVAEEENVVSDETNDEAAEDVSEQTDEEEVTDNDAEQEDESPDEDDESVDEEDESLDEDEESLDEDVESDDEEDESTDEEDDEITVGEYESTAELKKHDIDILGAGDNKISIKPIYVSNNPVPFDKWIQNGFSAENPYVLKSDSSFTLCGTMENVQVHKTGEGCSSDCNWTKTTNGYCIDRDGGFWFTPKNNDENKNQDLKRVGGITHEVVLDANGNPTNEVRVYVTYKAGTVTKDSMYNGVITFDNGFHWIEGAQNDTTTWGEFHVSVRPSFIKVYDRITERDMDKVNEYVDGIYLLHSQTVQVHDNYIWNSEATPYKMLPGQSVSIRGINGNNSFTLTGDDQNTPIISTTTGNRTTENEGENNYVTYTVSSDYTGGSKIFCVSYDTGCTDGKGNPITEKFYFQVININGEGMDTDYYDHADIEVADNSIYTMTETDAYGNYTVTKYEAYVSNVNRCTIWSDTNYSQKVILKDENQLFYDNHETEEEALTALYEGSQPFNVGNGEETKSNKEIYSFLIQEDWYKNAGDGSQLTDQDQIKWYKWCKEFEIAEKFVKIKNNKRQSDYIPAEDYWKDPLKTPKSPQFELTSKYVRDADDHIIMDTIYDNLRFKKTDIKTATFNVDLLFIPVSQEKYDSNNNLIETLDISELPNRTASNVDFKMNEQSVQDAYNKCPDHTGLDFTISQSYFEPDKITTVEINPVDVELDARKDFKNGTLVDDKFHFTLERYNSEKGEYEVIEIVGNKDNEITFSKLKCKEQGEYKFRIKEVPDEDDNTIEYDKSVIDITVIVEYDEDTKTLNIRDGYPQYYKNNEKCDKTVVFTNTYTPPTPTYYTLPSAGGPGVYIFIIGGAGLMLVAAIMFYRKKRKEM